MLFIGMAIGPALTGVYLESRESIDGLTGAYPTPGSYNLVYLASVLLSAVSALKFCNAVLESSNASTLNP